MEGWQAVEKFDVRIAGHLDRLHVDLIRPQLLCALLPYLVRLPHGDPDIGVEEVRTGDSLLDFVG